MAEAFVGFALLLCAAIAGGLYMTPLTVAKTKWSFEATWFLYCLFGLVIFPWIVGLLSCPGLLHALGSVDGKQIILIAVFGSLWGVGTQLFGRGISMVGNSLGFALILGLAATLGAAIPLVVLHPGEVASKAGLCTFAGLGLAVIALIATAYAGMLKERDHHACRQALVNSCDAPSASTGSFTFGIVICVLSGFFSACLNLANSFGQDIADAATLHGANKSMSTNAIYCVSIVAGGVINLVYCAVIMARKSEFPFTHGGSEFLKNLIMTMSMGVLWFGSNVAYGTAAAILPGGLGTVVGWPIYILGMVVFANLSGIVQGEWKGTRGVTKIWMAVGLGVLGLAIVAVGLAG